MKCYYATLLGIQMTDDAKQVFLVSGQTATLAEGGGEVLSSTVEQQVVVAKDGEEALALLSEKVPSFRPLGLTTLDDYEQAVAKIKATLKGVNTGWGLMLAPGLRA